MPRQRPSASPQVAWASQPTLRVRSWPRCRAAAAERRWRAGLVPPPASQGQPAGEQVGVDRTRGSPARPAARSPAGPRAAGTPDDPRLPRTGRAAGPAPPAPPTTGAAGGGTAARPRRCDPARGSRSSVAAAARAEEYSNSARLAAGAVVTLDRGHRHVDLAQGIPGQAAASSTVHLLTNSSASKIPSWSNRPWASSRWASAVGRSPRACAATPRSWRTFAYSRLLAALGPQRLDPGVVPVSPVDVAQGEVRRCPVVQSTRFPNQVACAGQQVDGGLGVPQSLGIAAQDPQGVGPADQDPAGRDAAAAPAARCRERTGRAASARPGARRRPGWPGRRTPGPGLRPCARTGARS